MLDLFIGLRRVIKRRSVHIDNSVFRLHWLFTSIMLISCSLIVTSRQYVGDPIDCLQTDDIPANILNTYCWIHSTYTMPGAFDKIVGVDVPHPGIERSRGQIYEDALENELIQQEQPTNNLNKTSLELSIKNNNQKIPKRNRHLFRSTKYRKYYTYYQWVYFTLFIEAIFFYLPFYIWKIWEGGLLYSITVGMQIAVVSKEEKERKRDILSEYLCNHLGHYKAYAYKYFFCELLCFANVTGQFFLLNWFFDGEFFQYGIKVIKYALHDPSLPYDPMTFVFPRMTKCTFHSYGFSGDVQRHDALCMLTLNVINEKIYIFIWFWFLLLWILLFFVILYRIIILFFWNSRKYFLSKRCTLSNKEDLKFICEIGNIGDFFLLYMLGSNLDPLLMRDITKIIAEQFENNIKIEMQNDNEIKKSKNNFLNEHHPYHLQSSAPIDDSITNQYLNPNYLNKICNPQNGDFNSINYRNCCLNDNCLSSGSNKKIDYTKNRTNYQERHLTNEQQNQSEFNCVGCFNQHNFPSIKCDNNVSKQDNYFTINQQRKNLNKSGQQKNNEEEIINCCSEDNQTTLAVNHCLKENCKQQKSTIGNLNKFNDEYLNVDDFRNSIRSISSIRSINKKETKINLSVSNNQSNKSTKSNLNVDDNAFNLNNGKNLNDQNIDQNLGNQINTSRKSFSNCTNSNCFPNKSLENSESISSLANSSSGFIDYESKLNGSNSEISINGNELQVLNEQDEIHKNSNQNLNKKHNNTDRNDNESIESCRKYSQNQSTAINLFSTEATNSTLNNSTLNNSNSIDQTSDHHHRHNGIELEQQDNLIKECENCNRKKNSIESNCSTSSDQSDKKDNNNFINNNKKNKRIFNFRPFSLNKTKSVIKEYDYKKSKNTIFNTNLSLPSFLNRKSNDNNQIDLNNRRQDYQYLKTFRSTSLNIEQQQQQNRNFQQQSQFRSNSSKRLNYPYHQNNQIYTGFNHNNSNYNQMNNNINQLNDNHSNNHSNHQFYNQQSNNQSYYYSSNRRTNKKIKDI